MTAVRPAWEQWDAKVRSGVPTESRAGACFAPVGKSGRSFRLTRSACVGACVREGAGINEEVFRACGSAKNYSHSSHKAEILCRSGLRREGLSKFCVPLFPRRLA